MAGKEMINIGKGRGHAPADGLIMGASKERVEPEDPLHLPLHLFHFGVEHRHVSAIPSVTEDEEQGPPGIEKGRMMLMKLVKGRPDVGSS